MAPSWLVTFSLLTSIAVGIALIFWARHLRNSGPLFTLKIWGQTLNATRPVMQTALGAILISSPMIVNASVKPPAVPAQLATRVVEMPHISEPDYQKVVFTRDLSHLDLRSIEYAPWYMLIPGLRQILNSLAHGKVRTNPATLTNYLWMRKRASIDKIGFKYSTRGKIDIRCLTHSYDLQHAMAPDQHDRDILHESWNIIVDVSHVPVGQDFLVINEVTYWNGFNGADGDWYATYPGDQSEPEDLSIMVLFPNDKPFTSYQLFGYPEAGLRRNFSGSAVTLPSTDNRAFYWAINQPVAGNVYEFSWKW